MEDVVHKTLEELKKEELIPEYEKYEERITKALEVVVENEKTLITKMCSMIDSTDMRKVEQAMSIIIGQDRVDDIKMAFAIESYRINITEKQNGQSVIQVYRNGVPFQPERMLISTKDIETARVLHWASIVIELFLFVLSCVGIGVCLNQAEMRTLVEKVEVIVQQSKVRDALNKFLKAWNQTIFSTWKKAKDIFYFLKEIDSLGKFWEIIKLIFKDMCKWEKIESMVEVVLMIVAAFAAEGIALIARIALAVNSHINIKSKIENIIMLSDIMIIMKKTRL